MARRIEYELKLDSFYYDQKSSMTKVVLKFRNKRTTITSPLNELLQDKDKLKSLHPMDLLALGVLAGNSQNRPQDAKSGSVVDNFLMVRMSPIIEIVGCSYEGEEKLITVRLKQLHKTITTTASDLLKNKKLINAIEYQDALSLGVSLGDNPNVLESGFIKSNSTYHWATLLKSGTLLVFIILSVLLTQTMVQISWLGLQLTLGGELLLLPAIIFLFTHLLNSNERTLLNYIFACTLIITLIFVAYFSLVSHLPYPQGKKYLATAAFNKLYDEITEPLFTYMSGYIFTGITAIFSHSTIKQLLGRSFSETLCQILESLIYVSVFFIMVYLVSASTGKLLPYLSMGGYLYTLAVTTILISISSFLKVGLVAIKRSVDQCH